MAIFFCFTIVFALLRAGASEYNGIHSYTKRHKSSNLPKRKGSEEEGQAMVPPSPRCWRLATSILSHVQQGEMSKHPVISSMDAAEICAILPDDYQKKLALEITRCHLADLGKPLLENSGDEESCNHDLFACLHNLSQAGEHAYTHYVSYVQQLCIRLTQELLFEQHHKSQQEMSAELATIAEKHTNQLQVLTAELASSSEKHTYEQQKHSAELANIVENHTYQMQVLSKIPEQVKSELTDKLQRELKMTLQASLKDELHQQLALQLEQQLDGQLTRLLRDQAVEQATFFSNILESFEVRDNHLKERYAEQMDLYAEEMKRQQEQIEANRADMERLSENVSQASQKMQPLLGLELFMKTMADGYNWMELIVYFFGNLVVIWALTRPKRCESFRAYLYGLVFVEVAAEVRLLCLYHHNMTDKDDQASVVPYLRNLVRGLECAIYVLGLLSTLFRSRRNSPESTSLDTEDTPKLEIQRILQELRENQLSLQRRLDAERFAPSSIPNQQMSIQEYHRPVEESTDPRVSEVTPFQRTPRQYRPISHDVSAQTPSEQWMVVPVEQTAATAPVFATPGASRSNYNSQLLTPWAPSRSFISHTPAPAVPAQTVVEMAHQRQVAPIHHADQTTSTNNDNAEEGSLNSVETPSNEDQNSSRNNADIEGRTLNSDEIQSNEASQGDRKRPAAAIGVVGSDRLPKKAKLDHEGTE